MRLHVRLLLCVLACCVVAAQASSAPIDLTVTGTDSSRGGSLSFLRDGSNLTAFVGVIRITLNGESYSAICADLFSNVQVNDSYAVTALSPSGYPSAALGARGERAAWLFVNYVATNLVDTVAEGQAIQLAVWDIIHDGGDGLSSGRVRRSHSTPSNVRSLVSEYLNASANQSSVDPRIYISSDPSLIKQALMADALPTEMPEPATAVLIGFGLVFLSRMRGKRGA